MWTDNKFKGLVLMLAAVVINDQALAKTLRQTLDCEVAIIGGGPAGVHSLYKLAPVLHGQVCLFEANDYFGGRVKDIPAPNGQGVFGVGALRVQQTQNLLFNLAKELGFDLTQQTGNYEVPYGPQRVFARRYVTGDVNNFLLGSNPVYQTPVPNADFPDPVSGYPGGQSLNGSTAKHKSSPKIAGDDGSGADLIGFDETYPNASTSLNCEGDANYNGCYNDAYHHALLNPEYTPLPGQYRDNFRWLQNVLTPEGFRFLTDGFRFRGDFENRIDPLSYIDFLKEDWDACCNPTYPEGGMSSFVNGMMSSALANGAKAFNSEPVKSIGKEKSKYTLKSAHYKVNAESVVIAVPAASLKKIGGSIAARIKARPEFKALQPIRVISINNWWKHPWWNNTEAENGSGPLDRAWATKDGVTGGNLCFNFMEFGHTDYHKNQNATRSVYNDDILCTEYWAHLYAKKGMAGVNEEIVREFKIIFPEAAEQISVDEIEKTAYQDWPDAWYWLKGPTKLTNEAVAIWALEPLPGEKVSLTSDAYNPNRTTWVDGALKSSINSLNYNYSTSQQHNARIAAYLQTPLPCSSVDLVNGSLAYVPFNQGGNFNVNCPLQ